MNEVYVQPICLCGEKLQLLKEVSLVEAYNLDKYGLPYPGAIINEEVSVNWQVLLCVKCDNIFEAILEEGVEKRVFRKDKKIKQYYRGKLVKPKKRLEI